MTTNPAAAGPSYAPSTGPVRSRESSAQAGPHIALTAEQIEGYASRIDRIKTAELHRFEIRQGVLPSSRASSEQLTTPEITRRIVQEPATPPSAERAEAGASVSTRPGVPVMQIVAFLTTDIDPEICESAPEICESALTVNRQNQLFSTGGARRD
jgi:hypothetical protein